MDIEPTTSSEILVHVMEQPTDTVVNADNDKSRFDHEFSGWSLWLEPEVTTEFQQQMDHLQYACGGNNCGVAAFVPHVTLLYNLAEVEDPLEQLAECWKNRPSKQSNEATKTINAYDWYYQHYPKSADHGTGFGCSISLLLIEPSRWLEQLQEACQETFGRGGRKKFIPHISLVYAPEDRESFLKEYTNDQQEAETFLRQPFRAKYLSLWSTQGKIQEWHRIAKIRIE